MKVNSMGDVAATVRGRRKDLGLSQADLATRMGVSRAWINAVEAGKPSVEFDLVLRLLDHLGLRMEACQAREPQRRLQGQVGGPGFRPR